MVEMEVGEPRDTHKSDAAATLINCLTVCNDTNDCTHKMKCEKHNVATEETAWPIEVGCLASAGMILAETLEPPSCTSITCKTKYNASNVKPY